MASIRFSFLVALVCGIAISDRTVADEVPRAFRQYCAECHDGVTGEGKFDLIGSLRHEDFDGTLVFENLITSKMPPADAEQPSDAERQAILKWLAGRKTGTVPNPFRRLSRHEFVHSVNDLLGTELDAVNELPEDRGTNDFDSDRRIRLSKEMLGAYFTVADKVLENALPETGFPPERNWVTNKLKDSHETYSIYVRNYQDGLLFSWTRANNGNSYSFFYDHFDSPAAGWYELTFDAMKVGEFAEHVSIQVHAGKYYYADDRPQPQRLLDVISLGNRELKSHTVRVFLNPGENVSVHCYSKHTFRKKEPEAGAYIKQLKARGPIQGQWPPTSYQTVFNDLPIQVLPQRHRRWERQLSPIREPEFAKTKVAVGTDSPKDLKRVIRRFADRAFSTSLSDEELEPYYNTGLDELRKQRPFDQAAKLAIKAVISSPRFLMTPGEHANMSFAKAADLARILWLSVPDAELIRLSESNQLTGDVMSNQIGRLLADEKSHRMIESFCGQWLNLRSWRKVTPSLKLYPLYDDLLNYYLPMETRAYLHYLIQENLPVQNLVDSNFSFLNQRLAQHYGIDGVMGQHLRKVTFASDVPRGGLLTMGSVLKVTTDGFDTSPILRGAWISKNIVGTPLSPPPEVVKAIEPDHGETAATLKEQVEQHKSSPACYACHKSIDPYGFALENFDAIGRWRTKYRVENPHKGTFQFRLNGYYQVTSNVDASGEIDEHVFENVFGLKKSLLLNHKRIAYNFVKKFFEYANGYKPSLSQRTELFNMLEDKPDACRMKDLITRVLVYSVSGDPQ